ncbi:hypothetical protein AVEN_127902-1 [Araneus ventricosus]|uniref:Uncharacterized protein n=1 Tax=Araneus ventricosus TaxID=182803 RepID=A0A4Y1ZYR5_ARAVE|nr:hypothetical protein AVEN_127902-1 [Araneus ventricosus]
MGFLGTLNCRERQALYNLIKDIPQELETWNSLFESTSTKDKDETNKEVPLKEFNTTNSLPANTLNNNANDTLLLLDKLKDIVGYK